jgi:hypothetical protein
MTLDKLNPKREVRDGAFEIPPASKILSTRRGRTRQVGDASHRIREDYEEVVLDNAPPLLEWVRSRLVYASLGLPVVAMESILHIYHRASFLQWATPVSLPLRWNLSSVPQSTR